MTPGKTLWDCWSITSQLFQEIEEWLSQVLQKAHWKLFSYKPGIISTFPPTPSKKMIHKIESMGSARKKLLRDWKLVHVEMSGKQSFMSNLLLTYMTNIATISGTSTRNLILASMTRKTANAQLLSFLEWCILHSSYIMFIQHEVFPFFEL